LAVREVIEKMLEIERHARSIVAKAEAEATRLTDAARTEARAAVERARQDALAQVDTIIQEAKAAAEKERDARLAQVGEKFQADKAVYEQRVAAVANSIVPVLLGAPAAPSSAAGRAPVSGAAGEPASPQPTGSSA
jgi:vacuolar-type H+-ATPase subunit H